MKVVATLACRVQSKRLYAKPLQFLDIEKEISILEYQVHLTQSIKSIGAVVLAISEGEENIPFVRLAEKMKVPYIIGSQEDVQLRLIQAANHAQGDIIYRVTTESPFTYVDDFHHVLQQHISQKASLTVVEQLPEGSYFELINVADIKKAHNMGERRHRSELCTLFMMEHPETFKLLRLKPKDPLLCRPDIRLTVDYPEDLIVVREVYKALKKSSEFINVKDIIHYLDEHPTLKAVNSWIDAGTGRIWK